MAPRRLKEFKEVRGLEHVDVSYHHMELECDYCGHQCSQLCKSSEQWKNR